MEAHTIQRIGAYIIDVFILSILVMLLTFWIPTSEKYKKSIEEENKLVDEMLDSEEIDFDKFYDKYTNIRYTLDKESTITSLISAVLSVGYFATFAYYYNGQTLGKKLLKIRIVSDDGKEASHSTLIIRSLFVNSVLSSLISIILIFFIEYKQYPYTVGLISIIQSIFMLLSLIMIITRNDKKGLHDVLVKTKVIQD